MPVNVQMSSPKTPKEFCQWQKQIRQQSIEIQDFVDQFPWHPNTIRSYDEDRLPDVDYLYALHKVSGYPFEELIQNRIKVGILGEQAEITW